MAGASGIRVPSKRERWANAHVADRCEDPERCYKCLRYANRVMQDAAQGLLDEIARLRAKLAELEGFTKPYVRQIEYLANRVKELEAQAMETKGHFNDD